MVTLPLFMVSVPAVQLRNWSGKDFNATTSATALTCTACSFLFYGSQDNSACSYNYMFFISYVCSYVLTFMVAITLPFNVCLVGLAVATLQDWGECPMWSPTLLPTLEAAYSFATQRELHIWPLFRWVHTSYSCHFSLSALSYYHGLLGCKNSP